MRYPNGDVRKAVTYFSLEIREYLVWGWVACTLTLETTETGVWAGFDAELH